MLVNFIFQKFPNLGKIVNQLARTAQQLKLSLIIFTFKGLLIAILGVCGIFGNTAAVILFRRKRQYQSNFYALMICLALFDMFYIILAIIIFSLPKFSKSFEDGAWQVITPWAIPLIQINLTGSIYCTMAITLERYLAVCKPFYRITREWSSRIFIIPILLISVIYNLPQFFEIQTCETRDTYIPDGLTVTLNRTNYCPGSIFQDASIESKTGTMPQNKTLLESELPNALLHSIMQNKTMRTRQMYVNFTNLRLDKGYNLYKTCSNFLINAAVPFIFIFILNAKILQGLKNRYIQTPVTDICDHSTNGGNQKMFYLIHVFCRI